ncbi:MAG: T9SS type A sorting domain-containing protein [Ignavibacteriae bacterium]|nr:T9SS type A sorting domain-containing protein [Ignavibacteriota bacterium]
MKPKWLSFNGAVVSLLAVHASLLLTSSSAISQSETPVRQSHYSEQLRTMLTVEIPAISGGAMAQLKTSSFFESRSETTPYPRLDPPIESGEVLLTSFESIDFDRDAENHLSGGARSFHIPPDPIGAAGPSHVVCVVNTSIEIYNKTGTLISSKRLGTNAGGSIVGSFFQPLTPVNNTFDPKVIYDQYENRFLVVTLEVTDVANGDPANTSRILVAVSATDDPTGTWFFHSINSKIFIDGADRWADYPGFAVDDKAVYITNNMFGFGGGAFAASRLWIVHKGVVGGFYGGGSATVTVHDPLTSAGLAQTGPLQPAHMKGTPPTGLGTYLVSSGWADGAGNDFLSVVVLTNPVTTPSFGNTFVALGGDIHNGLAAFPNAPQMGSATQIHAGDSRCLDTEWLGGNLWGTMSVNPPTGPDAGQATAFWFKITTPALSLLDKGTIGGEDIATGTHTFYPSLAIDASGNVGFGFAASGSSIFPGAYWTGRLAADPAGTVRASRVLRAGVDFYVRRFGGARNRWGDYSGMSIDPANGSFWVFNEFAMARGTIIPPSGEDGRWRTAFGNFTAAEITSVVEETLPEKTALLQNYPNPFNPSTTIGYDLARDGFVSLKVFNVIGEEVASLVNEEKPAGEHAIMWIPQSLASGVYFYRLQSGSFVESRKLLLLK